MTNLALIVNPPSKTGIHLNRNIDHYAMCVPSTAYVYAFIHLYSIIENESSYCKHIFVRGGNFVDFVHLFMNISMKYNIHELMYPRKCIFNKSTEFDAHEI